jgi:AcrR family transcriptional regulator
MSIVRVDVVADTAAELDGRHLRREQNREAVLDALVELFREGNLTPSTGEVAERARLSPRSLFRYFDDVDDLNQAAIDRQLTEARPLLDPGLVPDQPTAEKIARLVDARVRLFEQIAPARRAGRACAHYRPVVAAQLHDGRTFLRRQLAHVFAPELAGRADVFPALDALCAFETWELLRTDQGLSRATVVASLTAALTALLGGQP